MIMTRRSDQPRSNSPIGPDEARTLLLGCGIVSSLLYAAARDGQAALLHTGYSPFSRVVSDLSSAGAASGPAVDTAVLVSAVLLAAFGLGVLISAHGNRGLRLTGAILVLCGALWPLWLPFPVTAPGLFARAAAVGGIMHIVLGAVIELLVCLTVVFGGLGCGGWFRLYSARRWRSIDMPTPTRRLHAGGS